MGELHAPPAGAKDNHQLCISIRDSLTRKEEVNNLRRLSAQIRRTS